MAQIWHYTLDSIDWQELSYLYKIAPLGDKKPENLKIAFSNSRYVCFVYENDLLVGVGRALADGVDCSYLCDIAIHPEFQGLGIGKAIVMKLVELSKEHTKIILYANIGKEPFYAKLGFYKMNTAMAIFKDQKGALDRGYIGQ
ncbi:MAG: GNAT family N-acetyltransferase [Sulfurospirillaceae bacterium]|jgi:ribosomal protein S18 acetylase RimI-like enzyme|nr:GNAT family N-acetyltransferase [Sulfurospirillaceae bacterium]MDD2827045.1 GNAT family N-acetyltransferase [Sulfurospirillaceae bacterium]